MGLVNTNATIAASVRESDMIAPDGGAGRPSAREYVCTFVCVCVRVCVHVSVRACAAGQIHVCIQIYLRMCGRAAGRVHVHSHVCVCVCVCVRRVCQFADASGCVCMSG